MVWVNGPGPPGGGRKITIKEAERAAGGFVRDLGYGDMVKSFAYREGDRVVVSLISKQNGVLVYPDQIKVLVSLSAGQVLGMDATPYLMHHHRRDISSALLSREEAVERIGSNVSLKSPIGDFAVRQAVIPREDKSEVLCWEIPVTDGDNNFLVYINAKTGDEENVLHLIPVEDGYMVR